MLKWLKITSAIEKQEFALVFSVAVRMVCCVSPEKSLEATALLQAAGEDVSLIVKLLGKMGDEACIINGI